MTTYFPIVFETEESGAISAYVPGLPVYAAADTRPMAERAIRNLLGAYLEEHPESSPSVRVQMVKVTTEPRRMIRFVHFAASMLGASKSRAKASASRANGRLGGRPRKARAR